MSLLVTDCVLCLIGYRKAGGMAMNSESRGDRWMEFMFHWDSMTNTRIMPSPTRRGIAQ